MNSTSGFFDQAISGLDEVLCSDDLSRLSDAERIEILRGAGDVLRRAEALIVETVATADSDFGQRLGCRSANELVQRALRTDSVGAARVIKASKVVRRETELTTGAPLPARWPQLRRALLDGVIGVSGLLAATGPLEQAGPRVGAEDRLRADAELAAYARGTLGADTTDEDASESADVVDPVGADAEAPVPTPEDLRTLAQVIVAYLDPDGAEPEHERAARSRGVRLGRVKDGLIPISGRLLPEVAGQMQRIWDAYLNPKVDGPPPPRGAVRTLRAGPGLSDVSGERCRSDAGGDHGHPFPLPAAARRSRRSPRHRRSTRRHAAPRRGGADARGLRDRPGLRNRPRVGAHRRSRRRRPGVRCPARRVRGGGDMQRVLFDPEGRIIGIGTTERIFTVHQRRAITLRDKECLIPGCHVPASWCEIHHVTEHARGGPTHTDNGVTLCWHHHRTLDTSGWEFRMQNGLPQVRGPAWWDPTRRWWDPNSPLRRTQLAS